MVWSMTGFGSGSARDEQCSYNVEIRSVNHRYCDVRTHLPSELSTLQGHFDSRVRKRAQRGRVDVTISMSYLPTVSVMPRIDLARARGYQKAYQELSDALEMKAELTLETIASSPGVLRSPEFTKEAEALLEVLSPAVDQAMEGLMRMRKQEGESIQKEIEAHLKKIIVWVEEVAKLVPVAVQEKKGRLEKRLQELLEDNAIEPMRLAQEVAVIVDRTDITEELERLGSHLNQFHTMLSSDDLVGRKLDFLLQEMNREVNTIGSKSGNTGIAHRVVELKSELERVREQVQNIA